MQFRKNYFKRCANHKRCANCICYLQCTIKCERSNEEENKRIEALKKQTGWGTTGEEVPTLPESKSGLKFHTAAVELNEISDVFFEKDQLRSKDPIPRIILFEIN